MTGRSSARSTSGPTDDEYVFYDGPPFANGLPHYGHFLTGYVKDVVPRYQTMRGHRVERRFGWDCHGLPAEMEAEQQLGVSGRRQIQEYGIDRFNEHCRTSVQRVHGRVGAVRHPPGPLGRLRERLQDDGPRLHGDRHLGVQAALGQGPDLRGLPGHAVLVGRRDAAVELRDPPRRRHPAPPGPGPHRRLPPPPGRGRPRAAVDPGLDHDAVDAAVQPGPRRRPRHRLRGPAGARDRPALRAGRRPPWPSTRPRSGTSSGSAPCTGRDLAERTYEPLFPYFADHPNSFRVLVGDFVDTEEGTGSSTWRPASARTTSGSARPTASRWSCPSTTPAASPTRCPTGRARTSSTPTPRSSGAEGAGRRGPPRHLRAQLPALLADRHADHLQGRRLLVRRGHDVQGPPGRAQPGDQLDPRATSATAQFGRGWRGPGTGRSAATASGAHRSRSGERRPRPPAHRRLREPRRDRGRLRRAPRRPAPTDRRRAGAAQPRRPDRDRR